MPPSLRAMTTARDLEAPPINEVICGFIFAADTELSPTEIGRYWAERAADFPLHELKDAVVEPGTSGVILGLPPLRTWLITKEQTRLIQLQGDRMFVNWRRQSDEDAYPRFRTETPGGEPLLPFALREFERFARFCGTRGERPVVSAIELSKVDIFRKGLHWESHDELAELVPALKSPIGPSATRDIAFKSEERIAPGLRAYLTLASGEHRPTKLPVLRMETRIRQDIGDAATSLSEMFVGLDDRIDTMFFSAISEKALARFKAKGVGGV